MSFKKRNMDSPILRLPGKSAPSKSSNESSSVEDTQINSKSDECDGSVEVGSNSSTTLSPEPQKVDQVLEILKKEMAGGDITPDFLLKMLSDYKNSKTLESPKVETQGTFMKPQVITPIKRKNDCTTSKRKRSSNSTSSCSETEDIAKPSINSASKKKSLDNNAVKKVDPALDLLTTSKSISSTKDVLTLEEQVLKVSKTEDKAKMKEPSKTRENIKSPVKVGDFLSTSESALKSHNPENLKKSVKEEVPAKKPKASTSAREVESRKSIGEHSEDYYVSKNNPEDSLKLVFIKETKGSRSSIDKLSRKPSCERTDPAKVSKVCSTELKVMLHRLTPEELAHWKTKQVNELSCNNIPVGSVDNDCNIRKRKPGPKSRKRLGALQSREHKKSREKVNQNKSVSDNVFLIPSVPPKFPKSGKSHSLSVTSHENKDRTASSDGCPKRLTLPKSSTSGRSLKSPSSAKMPQDPFMKHRIESSVIDPLKKLQSEPEELDFEPGGEDESDVLSIFADPKLLSECSEWQPNTDEIQMVPTKYMPMDDSPVASPASPLSDRMNFDDSESSNSESNECNEVNSDDICEKNVSTLEIPCTQTSALGIPVETYAQEETTDIESHSIDKPDPKEPKNLPKSRDQVDHNSNNENVDQLVFSENPQKPNENVDENVALVPPLIQQLQEDPPSNSMDLPESKSTEKEADPPIITEEATVSPSSETEKKTQGNLINPVQEGSCDTLNQTESREATVDPDDRVSPPKKLQPVQPVQRRQLDETLEVKDGQVLSSIERSSDSLDVRRLRESLVKDDQVDTPMAKLHQEKQSGSKYRREKTFYDGGKRFPLDHGGLQLPHNKVEPKTPLLPLPVGSQPLIPSMYPSLDETGSANEYSRAFKPKHLSGPLLAAGAGTEPDSHMGYNNSSHSSAYPLPPYFDSQSYKSSAHWNSRVLDGHFKDEPANIPSTVRGIPAENSYTSNFNSTSAVPKTISPNLPVGNQDLQQFVSNQVFQHEGSSAPFVRMGYRDQHASRSLLGPIPCNLPSNPPRSAEFSSPAGYMQQCSTSNTRPLLMSPVASSAPLCDGSQLYENPLSFNVGSRDVDMRVASEPIKGDISSVDFYDPDCEQFLIPYCPIFLKRGACQKNCRLKHQEPDLHPPGRLDSRFLCKLARVAFQMFPFWIDRSLLEFIDLLKKQSDEESLKQIAVLLWHKNLTNIEEMKKSSNYWIQLVKAIRDCGIPTNSAVRKVLVNIVPPNFKPPMAEVLDHILETLYPDFICKSNKTWTMVSSLTRIQSYEMPFNILKEVLDSCVKENISSVNLEVSKYLINQKYGFTLEKDSEILHQIHRLNHLLRTSKAPKYLADRLEELYMKRRNDDCCNSLKIEKCKPIFRSCKKSEPVPSIHNNDSGKEMTLVNHSNAKRGTPRVIRSVEPNTPNAVAALQGSVPAKPMSSLKGDEPSPKVSNEVHKSNLNKLFDMSSIKIVINDKGRDVIAGSSVQPDQNNSVQHQEKQSQVTRKSTVMKVKGATQQQPVVRETLSRKDISYNIQHKKFGVASSQIRKWKAESEIQAGSVMVSDAFFMAGKETVVEDFGHLVNISATETQNKDMYLRVMSTIGYHLMKRFTSLKLSHESYKILSLLENVVDPLAGKIEGVTKSRQLLLLIQICIQSSNVKKAVDMILSKHLVLSPENWGMDYDSNDVRERDTLCMEALIACRAEPLVMKMDHLFRGMMQGKDSYTEYDVSAQLDRVLCALMRCNQHALAFDLLVWCDNKFRLSPTDSSTNRMMLVCLQQLGPEESVRFSPCVALLLNREPYVKAFPSRIEGLPRVVISIDSIWFACEVRCIMAFFIGSHLANLKSKCIPHVAIEIKECSLPEANTDDFPKGLLQADPSVPAAWDRIAHALRVLHLSPEVFNNRSLLIEINHTKLEDCVRWRRGKDFERSSQNAPSDTSVAAGDMQPQQDQRMPEQFLSNPSMTSDWSRGSQQRMSSMMTNDCSGGSQQRMNVPAGSQWNSSFQHPRPVRTFPSVTSQNSNSPYESHSSWMQEQPHPCYTPPCRPSRYQPQFPNSPGLLDPPGRNVPSRANFRPQGFRGMRGPGPSGPRYGVRSSFAPSYHQPYSDNPNFSGGYQPNW